MGVYTVLRQKLTQKTLSVNTKLPYSYRVDISAFVSIYQVVLFLNPVFSHCDKVFQIIFFLCVLRAIDGVDEINRTILGDTEFLIII